MQLRICDCLQAKSSSDRVHPETLWHLKNLESARYLLSQQVEHQKMPAKLFDPLASLNSVTSNSSSDQLMRFFTIETIRITKPVMNITAAAGIVKNINQGRAAQPQFPSFASGPQKTTESKAPKM